MKRELFWTLIIRPKILTYYPICYTVFSKINQVLNLASIALIIDIATVVFLPIISFYILTKNYLIIEQKEFKSSYESLYVNLKTNHKSATFYITIFCIRRILIGFSSVFWQQTCVGTIFPYMISSLGIMCMNLSLKQMVSKQLNKIEQLNEFCIILTSYFLLFCSDWLQIENIEVKHNVGFQYFVSVVLIFCVNFFFIIVAQFKRASFGREKAKTEKLWKEYTEK